MENKKNTAANNPEMVTISREEYEELKLQNQWLLEQLGLAKKRQFGASSERLQEGLMDPAFIFIPSLFCAMRIFSVS